MCFTQRVQVSLLVGEVRPQVSIRFLGMFLFKLSSFGVFVSEDEVQFVIFATFVGSKHDGVRSFIHKLLLKRQTDRQTQTQTHTLHLSAVGVLSLTSSHVFTRLCSLF